MKTSWRWLLFMLLVLAAALGYGVLSQPHLGGARWQAAQEDNVREAVFRRQIADHRKPGEVCFLTISGRDASAMAVFVARRFQDASFVKPLAASQERSAHSPLLMYTPTHNGYVDAHTGQSALHFSTNAVQWTSDARAEVSGDGLAAMESGNGGIYTVVWKGRHWNVTRYQMQVMF